MQFNWDVTYPHPRAPVFARNVVATTQPLAAQAGLHMLRSGGNAVDATIAAAAALTVVEPVSNGLGSDAFAILWDGKQLHGLNASGRAPAAWNPGYFDRHNNTIPDRGVDSITVPGAVAAWGDLNQRFGKLPLSDCLQPAIELAEAGYGVTPAIQRKWANQIPVLNTQPGFSDTFMPHGRAPMIGERFRMPAAARTLQSIARDGTDAFYQGEIAEKLCAYLQQHGGSMTTEDLARHSNDWCGTISKNYRGYEVHEIPPNGQGIAALMALGMLEHFDLDPYQADDVVVRHLQIETMKAAFADVYQHVGDPDYMHAVSADDLLDDAYLSERARTIKKDSATLFSSGKPPGGGTIYLTAADASGMMVSFIQSNFMGFGSGVVVPELGLSLQNRGSGFCLEQGHANEVGPNKRPFHTIIPAFLMHQGKPQMSFGVMGGNMQPQGHMQTISRMIDHQQHPQAACDAARWRVHRGLNIDLEQHMEEQVVTALRDRGHVIETVTDSYMDYGAGQFIWRLSDDIDDGYVAASDSRRDGHAACW